MKIEVPQVGLVVLIGASGSGKSSFARKHFLATEIVSSDTCRGLVDDDENSMDATSDAFELVHTLVAMRLKRGRLVVVDATNVQDRARKSLLALAREYHLRAVAIVFNLKPSICHERNQSRPDRDFGEHVVRNQSRDLRQSLRNLRREGFHGISVLDSVADVDAVEIERVPSWTDKRGETGPFDIIGDVHGCCDELRELLTTLGYDLADDKAVHPEGRRLVFLGDLVDRGPASPGVLRIAMNTVEAGAAIWVPGNHDVKLQRKLAGRDVRITHGLAETLEQLEVEPEDFVAKVGPFIDGLVSHFLLDGGKLCVAHAGMREEMQGRASGRVRDFALFGETTGETDEFGLPVRYDWASEYRGKAMVVYGHTPVPEAEWLNNTINIDTGCVFGGRLTALRYPERELVSVPARQMYAQPVRPLQPGGAALSGQQRSDDVLDLADIMGRRTVQTSLRGKIMLPEGNSEAALEIMSRFAAAAQWLVYLPPTMSPTETTRLPGLLEHPAEAFSYYRSQGVPQVVCEEKHMGSRAVVIVCRSAEVALRRFGVATGEDGIVVTRTGRRFFNDLGLEAAFLARVRTAIDNAGLWDELTTDWIVLDCELMPWSAKAQDLLRTQYAPVGRAALDATGCALNHAQAATTVPGMAEIVEKLGARAGAAEGFVEAYRCYCWQTDGLDNLRLAPFHLLASEGMVHIDKDHRWHMDTLARLAKADPDLIIATPYRVVDLLDEASTTEAAQWWEELVSRGGEGMVVKPLAFTAIGPRGLAQPAIKCRGPEYLRIIYGPEYRFPENLERLRKRGLARKRSLALREFALGIEGLQRFVRNEPLRRVHECAFAVLALETEPVDPRL